VMIEAVENHMPEVIVIDEIGTEAEAQAARTIAERGVQLVGTAHGQTLENLMLNPTLADLIGGIQAVTLSDAEAQRRGTQKTVLERKAPPTFDVVIELLDYDRLAVHHNVMKTVDMVLRGVPPRPEIRVRTGAGSVEVVQKEQTADIEEPGFNQRFPALARTTEARQQRRDPREQRVRRDDDPSFAVVAGGQDTSAPTNGSSGPNGSLIRIFPYGIARTRLERAIREKRAPAYVTNDVNQADAIMAIRSTYQSRPRKLRDLTGKPVNTVVVKSNTFSQIAEALEQIVRQSRNGHAVVSDSAALEEAQRAIDSVLQTGKAMELTPQSAPVRKLQHQIAEARRLASESVGEEPNRRIRILPTKIA